ncbi:MAG: YicC family protein [Clostridiales bacterium]|nr:YicC family protein [Clostridiales bacterium]
MKQVLKSMTGYGRGESFSEEYRFVVELKAVNSRFLELIVRLPRQLNPLEDGLKKILHRFLQRGRIEVFVNYEEREKENIFEKISRIKVDKSLALDYYNSMLEVAKFCRMESQPLLSDVARFPGVIEQNKEDADFVALRPVLEEALAKAIESLQDMRREEGRRLEEDLYQRLQVLDRLTEEITREAPLVVEIHQERLSSRIKELLQEIEIDQARLATEVAFFADRSDISEELIRLASHRQQFLLTLQENVPVGRKLEFILQEINREINTIGSKANHLNISQIVIAAKSELEKMREQVQNIE